MHIGTLIFTLIRVIVKYREKSRTSREQPDACAVCSIPYAWGKGEQQAFSLPPSGTTLMMMPSLLCHSAASFQPSSQQASYSDNMFSPGRFLLYEVESSVRVCVVAECSPGPFPGIVQVWPGKGRLEPRRQPRNPAAAKQVLEKAALEVPVIRAAWTTTQGDPST